MKKATIIICLIMGIQISFAQIIKGPSEGKAKIYFSRTSGGGFMINFKFFDGDQYIGKIKGGQYFVYECDPGVHSFWALSENMSMVYAQLEANKMYFIDAKAKMGALKANVKLVPLDKNHKKYDKNRNLVFNSIWSGEETILSEKEIKEGQIELKEKIIKGVRYVKTMNSHNLERPLITSDMFIEVYPEKN